MSSYFSSGFETGDLSEWDFQTVGIGNSMLVSNAYAMYGLFGMRSYTAGTNQNSYTAKGITSAVNTASIRTYFRIEQGVLIPVGQTWNMFNIKGTDATHANGDICNILVYPPDIYGNYSFHAQYVNGSYSYIDLGIIGQVSANTIHYIEISLTLSSGTLTIFLDGSIIYSTSGLSFGQVSQQYYKIGSFFSGAGCTGAIQFDEFTVAQNYVGAKITPLPLNTNNVVPIFSSGWETGDLSEWSSNTIQTGNSIVVDAVSSAYGAFGMHVSMGGSNGAAIVTRTLAQNYTYGNFRFYADLAANFVLPTVGDYLTIFNLQATGGTSGNAFGNVVNIGIVARGNSTFSLQLTYVNPAFTYTTATTIDARITQGVQHCYEIYVNTTSGTVTFYLDGVQVFNISNLLFGNKTFNLASLGSSYSSTDTFGDIYFDDFVFAASYIGTNPTPSVKLYYNVVKNTRSLLTRFHIQRLDQNLNIVQTVSEVDDIFLSGSISGQLDGVRRTGNLTLLEDLTSGWYNYRYKVYYSLIDAYSNEYVYPLGLFIPTNPQCDDSGLGFSTTYKLVDFSQLLKYQRISTPLVFASGTTLKNCVDTILTTCGITLKNLTDTGDTLNLGLAFDTGKTYLEVLQTLVYSFTADFFFDGNGYANLVPLIDPNSSPVIIDFERNKNSIFMSKKRDQDQEKYFNAVKIRGGTLENPYYYYNIDVAAKKRFGNIRVDYQEKNNALTNQTQTNTYGDRILTYGSRFGETVDITCVPVPYIDINNVFKIDGIKYQVTGYEIPLSLDAMTIHGRRGITI